MRGGGEVGEVLHCQLSTIWNHVKILLSLVLSSLLSSPTLVPVYVVVFIVIVLVVIVAIFIDSVTFSLPNRINVHTRAFPSPCYTSSLFFSTPKEKGLNLRL